MSKFKVGDRVRTKVAVLDDVPLGAEGKVIDLAPVGYMGRTITVSLDVGGNALAYRPSELELIDGTEQPQEETLTLDLDEVKVLRRLLERLVGED